MAASTGQASRQALQLTQSSATTKNQPVPLVFCPSPFLMQSTGQTSTQELSPSQISLTMTYATSPPTLGRYPPMLPDLKHPVQGDPRPALHGLRNADRVHHAPCL